MATPILSASDAPASYKPFKCVSCGLEGMAAPSNRARKFCYAPCKADDVSSMKRRAAHRATMPAPHSKACTKCGETKEIGEFAKDARAGHKSACKSCRNEATAKWSGVNRKKLNAAQVERRATDPLWKLSDRVRKMTAQAFSYQGYPKLGKTAEIIGCDWDFLFRHIERQFLPGMTWEKVGKEIHIDHITAISTAKTSDEVLSLSHFTNLRPMGALDNMKKGARRELLL